MDLHMQDGSRLRSAINLLANRPYASILTPFAEKGFGCHSGSCPTRSGWESRQQFCRQKPISNSTVRKDDFGCLRSWSFRARWRQENQPVGILRTETGNRLNPRASIRRYGTRSVKAHDLYSRKSSPCQSSISSATHRNTGKTHRDAGEAAWDRFLCSACSRSRLQSGPR